MTTIIYDHKNKQIACDSRTTQGNFIATDESIKHKYDENHGLWFLCGNVGEAELFMGEFEALKEACKNLDCSALYVAGGKVYLRIISNGVFRESLLSWSDGIGSGCEHAINALDFGKTAKESVEYASTRDSGTGGKVHVFDVITSKFIDNKKPLK